MKMLDIEQEQAYKRSCFSRNLKKAIGKQDKKALCKEIGILADLNLSLIHI